MIARTWTAQVSPRNESAYLDTVRAVVLPSLRAMKGYRGARFLRQLRDGSVDILVITFWESMEAVVSLTGGEPSRAYVPPEIAATLERFDSSASHYDVTIGDDPSAAG